MGGDNMLIGPLMLPREQLTTVTLDDSLETALDKINNKNFLSIPVVQDKQFVGMISKGEIYEDYFVVGGDKHRYVKETRVRSLIRAGIPTLLPNDEIEKAARTLELYGMPFVAVVDEKENFLGIITHYTIFKEFSEIMAIDKGKRLSIYIKNIPGQVARVSDIVARNKADLISFVIADSTRGENIKQIIARVYCFTMPQLLEDLKKSGYEVEE
jgi:acetoin utilization protein AcuB